MNTINKKTLKQINFLKEVANKTLEKFEKELDDKEIEFSFESSYFKENSILDNEYRFEDLAIDITLSTKRDLWIDSVTYRIQVLDKKRDLESLENLYSLIDFTHLEDADYNSKFFFVTEYDHAIEDASTNFIIYDLSEVEEDLEKFINRTIYAFTIYDKEEDEQE